MIQTQNHVDQALQIAVNDRKNEAGIKIMQDIIDSATGVLGRSLPLFALGVVGDKKLLGLQYNILQEAKALDCFVVATLQQVFKSGLNYFFISKKPRVFYRNNFL